jgi:hypothetical protein
VTSAPAAAPRVGRILIGAERAAAQSGGLADGEMLRSAFVITGPYVLTAWHCVRDANDAEPVWFRFRPDAGLAGQRYAYLPLRVVNADKKLDLAVLALDTDLLTGESLSAADAAGLLTGMIIPVGRYVDIGEDVRVMGFPASKPGSDSDTFSADVIDTALLLGSVNCLKLRGDEFAAYDPVDPHGLSGGPVLKARDLSLGASEGEVAVGLVRGVPEREGDGTSPGGALTTSSGGAVIATRLADAVHLPEIGAALLADASRARRQSDYLEEIALRLPKGGLRGRASELAELAAFARPDPAGAPVRPYADWVAEAYAGKTALAAQFASDPPPGVDVVAFFVSRWGGQTSQFLENACDQLAALVNRPKPSSATAGTFSSLWKDAGKAAEGAGRTLLLLLDGLDENDPSLPAVARSIPDDGDAYRRVVVFRRDPPELDLEPGHPFLDPGKCIRKTLRRSEYAEAREAEAKKTLLAFLEGRQADALGRLAAAGPLTAREIAELIALDEGIPEKAIQRLAANEIRPALERAVNLGLLWPLPGSSRAPEEPKRYAFQHDKLREITVIELDHETIDGYQEAVKEWAATFEEQGWPAKTPGYLLFWYPAMLAATGDTARLTALTTDVRLSLLRSATGDDAAGIDELTMTLGHLAKVSPADLPLTCRIAVRREKILRSLAWYPMTLIQACAAAGNLSRAHHLATHLESPAIRGDALLSIALAASRSAAGIRDQEEASGLFVESLKTARDIAEPSQRNSAVLTVARASVTAAQLIDPGEVTSVFPDPQEAVAALGGFASFAASAGHLAEAEQYITEAYVVAAKLEPAEWQPEAVSPYGAGNASPFLGVAQRQGAIQAHLDALETIRVAAEIVMQRAVGAHRFGVAARTATAIPQAGKRITMILQVTVASAGAGQHDLVPALLADAFQAASTLTDCPLRAWALGAVTQAAAAAGHPLEDLLGKSRQSAEVNRDPVARTLLLAAVAQAAQAPVDGLPVDAVIAEARRAACDIADPRQRVEALATIIAPAATVDHLAADLIAEARQAANAITVPGERTNPLLCIGEAAAAAGHIADARLMVAGFDESIHDWSLGMLTQAAVRSGHFADAWALAHDVTVPGNRADELVRITQAATAAGALTDAWTFTAELPTPSQQAWSVVGIAQAAAAAGQPVDQLTSVARQLAHTVADHGDRTGILTAVAQVAAAAGDGPTAAAIAAGMPDPAACAEVLAAATHAAAAAGRFADARTIAAQMSDPFQRSGALAGLAQAMANAGQPAGEVLGEARQAARDINVPGGLAPWALGTIVQAAIGAGCLDQARAAADLMTDDFQRSGTLANIGRAAAAAGEPPGDLFDAARQAAIRSGPNQVARALGMVVQAAIVADCVSDARAAAGAMTDPYLRAMNLASIAAAAGGQHADDVADILAEVTAAISHIGDPSQRAWALGAAAVAAAATGDTGRATQYVSQAEDDSSAQDPALRAALLGALARSADAGPSRSAALFSAACQATEVPAILPRTRALAELGPYATGHAQWPAYLASQVNRIGDASGSPERVQALAALVQAADSSGEENLARRVAGQIPDAATRVWMLTGLARSAAASGNSAVADEIFGEARLAAQSSGYALLPWAPGAIAEAAAACRRIDVARTAAREIQPSDPRLSVMDGIIAQVAAMSGDEPEFFFLPWSSGGDLGHAVTAEAACGLRWFSTAAKVAGRVGDLNRRAYVLLAISEAALAAGDTERALSAAQAVTSLRGQVERVLRGKALALTVSCLLARGDPDTARSTLVSGLTDCFAPDLIAAAHGLDPPVAGPVLDELNEAASAGP